MASSEMSVPRMEIWKLPELPRASFRAMATL
jgi:hypothetical protein